VAHTANRPLPTPLGPPHPLAAPTRRPPPNPAGLQPRGW